MAVPRALLTAMALALSFLLVPAPASAGDPTAPEVSDGAGDPTSNGVAVCPANTCAGPPQFVDLTMGWVGVETETDVILWMDVAGNANANAYGDAIFEFRFKVDEVEYIAGFRVNWAQAQDGAVSPFGVATAAAYADAAMMVTVPKSNIGSPAVGVAMVDLFVTSQLRLADQVGNFIIDRAPNGAAFGLPYTFMVGGSTADQNDTDADGLNDTWETDHFGNLTAENGTGDPDGDGLNNTEEQTLGTDPTQADTDGDGLSDGNETTLGTNATLPDTDGDGVSDGDEVLAGTDPLVADLAQDDNSTIEENTATEGEATSSSGKTGLDKYVESLKADTGYAGASGAGFGAVLLLSIIGLAGRWGL